MSIFIGCDNGVQGGLAMYNSETNYLEVVPMPVIKTPTAKGSKNEYDIPAIIQWLNQFGQVTKMVILEKAQSFPGQGVVSQFTIGKNYGIMCGLLAGLGLPHTIVNPRQWQKKMFEGVAHTDTKQASALVAQRLWPSVSFKATPKSTKIHSGLTDAALLAYYGSKI